MLLFIRTVTDTQVSWLYKAFGCKPTGGRDYVTKEEQKDWYAEEKRGVEGANPLIAAGGLADLLAIGLEVVGIQKENKLLKWLGLGLFVGGTVTAASGGIYIYNLLEEKNTIQALLRREQPHRENSENNSGVTKEEIRQIREDVRIAKEELAGVNEELGNISQELAGVKEELENTKEELRSAKEELRSAKEELNGIREELKDDTQKEELRGIKREVSEAKEELIATEEELRLVRGELRIVNEQLEIIRRELINRKLRIEESDHELFPTLDRSNEEEVINSEALSSFAKDLRSMLRNERTLTTSQINGLVKLGTTLPMTVMEILIQCGDEKIVHWVISCLMVREKDIKESTQLLKANLNSPYVKETLLKLKTNKDSAASEFAVSILDS